MYILHHAQLACRMAVMTVKFHDLHCSVKMYPIDNIGMGPSPGPYIVEMCLPKSNAQLQTQLTANV
jgi:hypothetical protein